MLTLNRIVANTDEVTDSVTLPFDMRQKSRQRVTLASGRAAALMLERGMVLRGNDRLGSDADDVILVVAARERVSTLISADVLLLARAAYHLGNRHVPLQVGDGFLRYQHDHVLDDMVRAFGLEARVEDAAFEPEAGAYGHHSHSHAHAQQHPHVMLLRKVTSHP